MDNTEPLATSKDTDGPAEDPYADMSREDLIRELYGLKASLSAARAAKEAAEARHEFVLADLKRHRERIAQYRRFAAQWRTLATAMVEGQMEMLESALKVEGALVGEPDGREIPSLAELALPRPKTFFGVGRVDGPPITTEELARQLRETSVQLPSHRERMMEAKPFEPGSLASGGEG